MNKPYEYRIRGVDGTGYHFDITAEVNCRYDEVWTVANQDAIAKLREEYSCPFTVLSVVILNMEHRP